LAVSEGHSCDDALPASVIVITLGLKHYQQVNSTVQR